MTSSKKVIQDLKMCSLKKRFLLTVSDNIRKCAEHALPKGERARARAQIGPAAVYVKNFFEKLKKRY